MFLVYAPRRVMREYRYTKVVPPLRQQILTYQSNIEFNSVESLPNIFEQLGFHFVQGAYATYLWRRQDIDAISSEISNSYPYPFGLKIFNSTDMSPDGTPYAASNKSSRYSSPITKRAVGPLWEKMIISNILSLRNVAPRIYDIVKLQSGETTAFAFVVQHIDGRVVTGQAASRFFKQFKRVLVEEEIEIFAESTNIDFRSPSYNKNIVSDSTGTYYVDIQEFGINRKGHHKRLVEAMHDITHFGASQPFRPKKYAYQSVPGASALGKRDSLYRISNLDEFLGRQLVDYQNSTVLDVGCNLGIFTAHALSRGARWVVGLDTPKIIQVSKQFLIEGGFSRFDLIGCDLRQSDVSDLLPFRKFDLLLFLSVEMHIGFPEWLSEMDFRYFLYEGHENESVKEIATNVKRWRPEMEILAHQVMQDGDTFPRPMVLCRFKVAT